MSFQAALEFEESFGEPLRPLPELEAEWFSFARVPGRSHIRCCRARYEGGLWCPDALGSEVFVSPVTIPFESSYPRMTASGGPIIDLVAWHPDAEVTALRRDSAVVLGNIGPQIAAFAEPVPVWRTVARWYASGRKGIVFLTSDWRDIQPVLEVIDFIRAEDQDHADELTDILQWRPCLRSRITVARGRSTE